MRTTTRPLTWPAKIRSAQLGNSWRFCLDTCIACRKEWQSRSFTWEIKAVHLVDVLLDVFEQLFASCQSVRKHPRTFGLNLASKGRGGSRGVPHCPPWRWWLHASAAGLPKACPGTQLTGGAKRSVGGCALHMGCLMTVDPCGKASSKDPKRTRQDFRDLRPRIESRFPFASPDLHVGRSKGGLSTSTYGACYVRMAQTQAATRSRVTQAAGNTAGRLGE